VSVTLRDPVSHLSAICHAAMPTAPHNEPVSLRYADHAVSRMIDRFISNGCSTAALEVKLLGGADTRRAEDKARRPGSVGQRNIEAAVAQLGAEGFTVSVQHVGGDRGRRVLFVPATGEVFVHMLPRSFSYWGTR
jgi:chemotaxis protein CheD